MKEYSVTYASIFNGARDTQTEECHNYFDALKRFLYYQNDANIEFVRIDKKRSVL